MEARKEQMQSLEEGKLLSVKVASFARIACSRGNLWITFDGSGDIVLREGESAEIRSRHPLCVTALTDASFSLKVEPKPHSKLDTITAFLSFISNRRESSRRNAVLE